VLPMPPKLRPKREFRRQKVILSHHAAERGLERLGLKPAALAGLLNSRLIEHIHRGIPYRDGAFHLELGESVHAVLEMPDEAGRWKCITIVRKDA